MYNFFLSQKSNLLIYFMNYKILLINNNTAPLSLVCAIICLLIAFSIVLHHFWRRSRNFFLYFLSYELLNLYFPSFFTTFGDEARTSFFTFYLMNCQICTFPSFFVHHFWRRSEDFFLYFLSYELLNLYFSGTIILSASITTSLFWGFV